MLLRVGGMMGAGGNLTRFMLGGTLLSANEQDIIDGGMVLTIDLLGGLTWHANVGDAGAQTDALLDNITGEAINATDWDSVVRPALDETDVVRTSDTRVTITLPAVATYLVDQPETVTVVLVASIVEGTEQDLPGQMFTISEHAVTVAISGNGDNANEVDIRGGTRTLSITLTGGEWETTLGQDNSITDDFIASFSGDDAGSLGWDDTIGALLTFSQIVRSSSTLVTVLLQSAVAQDYNAVGTETITLNVNPSGVVDHSSPIPTDSTTFVEEAAVIAITGTQDEEDIRTGAASLTVDITTPTFGKWAASTSDIAAGLSFNGDLSETYSWDLSGPLVVAGNITRDSDTRITIALPAADDYAINANETVTLTVNAQAFEAYGSAAPTDTFLVTNLTPTASLSGTIVDAPKEDVQGGTTTLIIDVTAHKWVESFSDTVKQAILDGISGDAPSAGWDQIIDGNIPLSNVVRTDDDTVTITVPQFAGYDPEATETITVTVPAAAVHGYASALGDQTFTITAVFSPDQVANMTFWLDANEGISYSVSPDISAWDDQSGNGHHFTQGTQALQPSFEATGLNGKATVRFASADSNFLKAVGTADHADFKSSAGYTFFAVMETVTSSGDNNILRNINSGSLGDNDGIAWQYDANGNWDIYFDHNAGGNAYRGSFNQSPGLTEGTPILVRFYFDPVADDIQYWEDGVEVTAIDINQSDGTMGEIGADQDMHFGKGIDLARYVDAKFSEVIMYKRALSSSEISDIEAYLTTKWGL